MGEKRPLGQRIDIETQDEKARQNWKHWDGTDMAKKVAAGAVTCGRQRKHWDGTDGIGAFKKRAIARARSEHAAERQRDRASSAPARRRLVERLLATTFVLALVGGSLLLARLVHTDAARRARHRLARVTH